MKTRNGNVIKALGVFTLLLLAASALCQPPLPAVPIDRWILAQPNWLDAFSNAPLGFTGLNTAPGWSEAGTALSVDTNESAFLNLSAVNDGVENFTLPSGTISFWFQPNYNSVPDGGNGPTNWANLLTIGQWTSNATASCWSLFIDPDGTNLIFLAQSNGASQIVLTSPIDFDAGDWHNVCVAYSATNCCLYLEGELVTNADAAAYTPTDSDCAEYGAFVGSESSNGVYQARGQFQDLETYNGPLSADEVAQNYADAAAIILNAGGSLPSGFHTDIDPPPDPGGGVTGGGGGSGGSYVSPSYTITTNYADYTNFWLTITNNATNAYVLLNSTLSNLTYAVLTNNSLANSNGWGVWTNFTASNSLTPARPIAFATNTLFFKGALVWSTTTNGLPDYWCMEYFKTLNVDPYADPDGDGLCNLDEFLLGTNPTNANSKTSLHNDAQALFLAYTNFDTNCRFALFVTNANTNTILVTMSNTLVGSNYQIYTCLRSDTNNTWRVETNFLGTNTETTVAISLNGRSLFFVGGYGEDSDGDGLPDGYEVVATLTDPYMPDTGLTGTPDGYKDPDGDGYSNLQEMYNGTNPDVFDTPAGPTNLVADIETTNTVLLSWQAAAGPVTGYVISAYDNITESWNVLTTAPPTQLTYTLSDDADYVSSAIGPTYIQFDVQAIYPHGTSYAITGNFSQHPVLLQSATAPGPGGNTYLLVSVSSTNIVGYKTTPFNLSGSYGSIYPFIESGYFPSESISNGYIPATQFSNGIAILPASAAIPYAATILTLTASLRGGTTSDQPNESDSEEFLNLPFIDGAEQMKENVRFLLRVATTFYPFISDTVSFYGAPRVVSSLYYITSYEGYFAYSQYGFYPNRFAPFQDNYYYRNFVFDSSLVGSDGYLDTGFWPFYYGVSTGGYNPFYSQYGDAEYAFDTYGYVTSSNGAPVPSLLSSNETPFVGYMAGELGTAGIHNPGGLSQFGVSGTSNLLTMSAGSNAYGLPYDSLLLTLSNGGVHFATLSATNDVSGFTPGNVYLGTPQPELQTLDYYFCKAGYDPMPSETYDFADTDTTPLIVGAVGSELNVAGYARQAVLNGNTNVFAYVGQYFSNALVMSNGIVMTNSAGILSEYGEFFPTIPGKVALQTMPDPDQGNTNGTCSLDIIRLSLDVNHDGIMDESFTGPDNTDPNAPFVFWANNNYDRWTTSVLDGNVEDDVPANSISAIDPVTGDFTPDYDYSNVDGRAIPCPRDLEDFARLWISGISNTLSRLPTGSTVTLNWGDVGDPDWNNSNPTIDIFQAADAGGGIGYLTNLTTASNQINNSVCKYVGRLGPGSNMVLNSSSFSNGWAGDHFIWCGVFQGSGTLSLTVSDGDGNALAESSASIQIEDIKQMYERWTVGDAPGSPPMSNAVPAEDNFSPGYPQQSFQYPYDPAYDTNDTYILFVHGYNMEPWEKDRYAETMYKRLYWQGYQGRLGSFRWPTYQHFYQYDQSESQAWNSGLGLENLLTNLNKLYPGNVYVMAHSMGNVVIGEALRLAGTNKLVNTYVASQAAVSARAYDNTIAQDVPYTPLTSDSEGHYFTNEAPPYFTGISSAAHFVDFYNPGDWALGKWVLDQELKPDLLYGYTSPSSDFPSGYWFKPYLVGNGIPLFFPTNTYQIFSHCVQSYSLTLGAETNIASPFNSSVLPVNLSASTFDFLDTHPGHSEQFRFDNMTTQAYWEQLLESFAINTSPE